MWHADGPGDGVMDIPDIQYARNGSVALAYQVLGDKPLDLVYMQGFINNIDIAWDNPHYARFLRRLSSFSRLIVMDRRGTGLSVRMSPEDWTPCREQHADAGSPPVMRSCPRLFGQNRNPSAPYAFSGC